MKYHGGKNGSGVFQRLVGMMPPHVCYIEAFLGSGAILRRKRPATNSIGLELDRNAIWEIKDHLPGEAFEPWAINAEWRSAADDMPGNGGTSIGFYQPGTSKMNLEILNVDAFDPAETILYVDPPYPKAVRSSQDRRYKFELMEQLEHGELCDLLLAIPCNVMLSGYDNDLYNDKLKGWRKETINTSNRAGSRVIETVWLNFPPPVELHDYQFAGDNFRDRWRIEKRRRNWLGQLRTMSASDRGALIADINAFAAELNEAGRADIEANAARLLKAAKRAEKKLKPTIATPKTALAAPVPLF